MTEHSDRWRAVVVDEDDFRLACHLVTNWRATSDGSDPELTDRIAAAITHARTQALADAADQLASGGYEPVPSDGYPHFDCEDRVAEWLRARAGGPEDRRAGRRVHRTTQEEQ